MDLSNERFDRVIHLLYEAVANPSGWKTFFDLLGDALDAATIHLLALDKQHGALSYSDGFNLPVDGELGYIQKYGKIDPRMGLLLQKNVAEWLHCHEAFDEAFVAQDPFYQEFLIPVGRRYVSGCKLVDDDQTCVIFSVLRGVADQPLGPPEVAFLIKLTPHLQRAIQMQLQRFVFSAKALVGHALVNRLRQPVMLLTVDGNVVLSNPAAERLCATTALIKVAQGHLQLPSPVERRFYAECARLEGVVRAGDYDVETVTGYRSLPISATSKKTEKETEILFAFFSLLIPMQVSGSFGLRPLVLLLFYHPSSAPPLDSSLLIAAFNLSPAEARICRLLADGMALKEIANQIGVQHETIRKQLQAIYRKTATNRQSDLMRLMLNLPDGAFFGAVH